MKSTNSPCRLSSLKTITAALALNLIGGPAVIHAANYNWDPTPSTGTALGGGTGNWDLTSTFWYNGAADVI